MNPTLFWALTGNLVSLGIALLLWFLVGPGERPLMVSGHVGATLGLFWASAVWILRRRHHQFGRLAAQHPAILVGQFLCLAGCVYAVLIALYFMIAQTGLTLSQTWNYTALLPRHWVITSNSGTLDLVAVAACCLIMTHATSSAYFILPMFWALFLTVIRQCLRIPPVDPELMVQPTLMAGAPSQWAPAMLLAAALMAATLVATQAWAWKASRRRALLTDAKQLLRPPRSWPGLAPSVGALGFFILVVGSLLLVFPAPAGAFCSNHTVTACSLAAGISAVSVLVVANRHWTDSLGEIAVGLISLTICCATLAFNPAQPGALNERFPLLFTSLIVACALATCLWMWIAGVWEQQLDDQGLAWTTAGKFIPVAQRGSFMTGLFAVLFALQLSVWPTLTQTGNLDNSPGRIAWGLGSTTLLICSVLWAYLRTGRRPFRLLVLLGTIALLFFAAVRCLPYTTLAV